MNLGDDSATVDTEGISTPLVLADSRLSILVIDDEVTVRDSCANILRSEGYRVGSCSSYVAADLLLTQDVFDILLVNGEIGGESGLPFVAKWTARRPECVIVLMTADPTVSASLQAIDAGARHYLPKPFSANHLQVLFGRIAYLLVTERSANDPAHVDAANHLASTALIGVSPSFTRVVELARKAAPTDASIFVSGESGTGKEQIASFIHRHSRRAHRPFVAINCAALPEALLESEMFGHVKGAFTGAERDKQGLLEAASGGTMFLDELTEMPTTTQAKLLRVIQDGVVRRLGSNAVDATVNVRFIAATNRDPREAVQAGRLREDLYYRLRVVPITVPPLRDRPDDISLLAEFFLRRMWARHRGDESPMPAFGEAAIEELRRRSWRGNVRELQNVVEHAVVLLQPGSQIHPEDLPVLEDNGHSGGESQTGFAENDGYYGARDRIVSHFERGYLKWLVTRASGNMSMAARIAGVDRTTLYRLMEKHAVQRDKIITIR